MQRRIQRDRNNPNNSQTSKDEFFTTKRSPSAVPQPTFDIPPVQRQTEATSPRKPKYTAQQLLANSTSPPAFSPPPLQAKLEIGAAGDRYEQEADRVAAQVMQSLTSSPLDVSRKPQTLQRQDDLAGGEASRELESGINRARGGGQPLDANLQRSMGRAMGADFSSVRVHTDSRASELSQSIQAKAFTTGQDVFFKQGSYNPGSREGQTLIAHELTHVTQQNPDTVSRKSDRLGTPSNPIVKLPFVQRQPHTIQRELMNEKEFKQLLGKSEKDEALKNMIAAVKQYKAQPPVGKSLYLERLIQQGTNYITVLHPSLESTDLRKKAVIALIKNARSELKLLNSPEIRQIDEKELETNQMFIDNSKKKYEEIDGQQYRITGTGYDRKIELVKRRVEEESDEVYYVALGEVIDFNGKTPVIQYYNPAVDLGSWYPKVTQVNGMNIKPTTGIRDACSLHAQINETIAKNIDSNGGMLTMGQGEVDLLYTYSAKLGTVGDPLSCIGGKFSSGLSDKVTQIQMRTIMDAIRNKNSTVICAHSRGTIKTNNAVINAFNALLPEYKQQYQGKAGEKLKDDMNTYIKLIYAGNAVKSPSSIIPPKLYVTKQQKNNGGYTYDNVSQKYGIHSQERAQQQGVELDVFEVGSDIGNIHSFTNYHENVGKEVGDTLVPKMEFDDYWLNSQIPTVKEVSLEDEDIPDNGNQDNDNQNGYDSYEDDILSLI